MTRDEAIDLHKKAMWPEGDNGARAWSATAIECYVALGMLKLDEPSDAKTAAQKLAEELDACGYSTGEINEVFDCAVRANVKIVSK
jgi:hypothetical protein